MGVIVVKNAIEREKGKMYYIDKEGNLCEAKLQRGKKKGTKCKRKYITQEEKKEMLF